MNNSAHSAKTIDEISSARSKILVGDLEKFAHESSISFGSKIFGRGLQILSQVFIARLFGPAVFGLYSIGWTILRIAGDFAPLGLDNAVIRFIPRYRYTDPGALNGVLVRCLGISVLSGLILGCSLYWSAPWLAIHVFGKPELISVLRLFAIAFPAYAGLRAVSAATRATQQMKYAAYTEEVAQPGLNLLFIFLFFILGWHLLGMVTAATLSFALAFLLGIGYLKRLFADALRVPQSPGLSFWELISFSLPTSLAGLFAFLILWMDRLMVGFYLPAQDVGIYQAVSQWVALFAVILDAFAKMMAPMVSQFYQDGEHDRLHELFRVCTKWTLYLCVPAFLISCFAPDLLLTVIFGPEYEAGWLPLIILSVGQLINAGTGAIDVFLIQTGHQNRWLRILLVIFILNAVLLSYLIPRFGITGAATASSIAVIALFAIGFNEVRRVLHLWPFDRRYLKILPPAVLSIVILIGIRHWDAFSPVMELLLMIFAVAVVFSLSLFFMGLDPEDREILSSVRKMLHL